VTTGRDITHRKRAEEALRRLTIQLELEAARIAGVLHDEAGQFLASAHIMLADTARDLPASVQARLQQVRQYLDQVEAQLRRLSHELHPSILDDLGLVEAVRFIADTFARRTGISITVDAYLAKAETRSIATAVYRFVQESLTNMGKHARATTGAIVLRREGSLLCCSVRDDGVGFDADGALSHGSRRGIGLTLIQDRLEAFGGELKILSAAGQGTELRMTIPVED
jgi:signal transduction histidine kinase